MRWVSDMSVIEHNLEMVYLSRRYDIQKGDDNSYTVYDSDNELAAFYDTTNNKWSYYVTDVYNSSVDYIEIKIDALNNLMEFTRLLTISSSGKLS